ncbi:hypothetical protein WN943_027266 [Citrus x changshan-huyou]
MHGSERQRREFKEKGFRRARVNTLTCSLVSPHKDCSLLGLWVCAGPYQVGYFLVLDLSVKKERGGVWGIRGSLST